MILVAIGSNLPSVAGTPRETCEAALRLLPMRGVRILSTSKWYETAPVPVSDQPWFVNGVVRVETLLNPLALLQTLHDVELEFMRTRSQPNAARTLDLDLLDYEGLIFPTGALVLPHPRLQERAFVLYPLHDVAPDWRHPVLGLEVSDLIQNLPEGPEKQEFRPIPSPP